MAGGFDLSEYVDVAERIRLFKEKYPEGSLQPLDHSKPYTIQQVGEAIFVVYTAAAYRTPDDPSPGVGIAWEPFPGKTPYTRDSELMNAETSAWGRAIIAVGLPTKKIASAEEVRNRQDQAAEGPTRQTNAQRLTGEAGAESQPIWDEAGNIVGYSDPPKAPPAGNGAPKATEPQLKKIHATVTGLGDALSEEDYKALLAKYGVGTSRDLSKKDASGLIDDLLSVAIPPRES